MLRYTGAHNARYSTTIESVSGSNKTSIGIATIIQIVDCTVYYISRNNDT